MPEVMNAGTVTGVAPRFLVDDVERTALWYQAHLGFTIGEYFREDHGPHDERHVDHARIGEPLFVILNRNGQRLMLGRTDERGLGVRSNREYKPHTSDVYFWVTGVEALFKAVKATGVHFEWELTRQPYGLRDFQVRDCDGRAITFGGA